MEVEFVEKINLVNDIWEMHFSKPAALVYDAGDYVDLAIPNVGAHMLSMSSHPSEESLKFTVRISETNPSRYKQALASLNPGDKCYSSPAIGNFNLPFSPGKKLLFIALGIGITPYRSLLQEAKLPQDTQIIYAAHEGEHIYEDVIEQSGAKYLNQVGQISAQKILDLVADCHERIVYLSGPEPACIHLYAELLQAGIERHQIKLEYFPGYN